MRQFGHRLVGVAFWGVLFACWILLARAEEVWTENLVHSVEYLAVVAGAVLAVTLWWIRHNVSIYQRKGPRKGRPEDAPRTDEDRLGRPIRWQLDGGAESARDVGHLIVGLDGSAKVYRAAS